MKLLSINNISLIGAVFLTLSLSSCSTTPKTSDVATEVNDHHTAENSLDYDGIYLGVLPCADCSGIKTTVYLNTDHTYVLKQEYLGKETSKIEEKGEFIWAKNQNYISLKPSNADGQKLKLFVGENTLTLLDQSGNKITSSLADHYILSKDNAALMDKKWNITELFGKSFSSDSTMKKEGYIQFDSESNRFSSNAGCNQMNGSFTLKGNNKIDFGNAMSTMMACPDMSAEQSLGKVISATKSFQLNMDELSLLDKDQKVIAKFKVAMN